MAYNLGKVKSHVEAAANTYGPKFGIKTIYGVGAGSVPGSDHPKGLALDFMINNIPSGKSVGDALAAALLADPSVKYVIWYRQINTKDGRGWRTYVGPRSHTDHVHASFNPSGTSTGGTATQIGSPLVPDSVEKLAAFFSNPSTWRKVSFYTGGAILIIVGVILMAGGTPVGTIAKVVT